MLVAFTVSQIFPAVALAEPEVYGKLLLSVEHIDDETDANDYWDVKSHDSRFGIKGDFATDTDSLKVIYQLEWAVDITDEANSSNDHIKARNQYVGLQGTFGEIIAGRNDTPLKSSQGKFDLFNDYLDMKVLMAGAENRESNIIQYTAPKLADAVTVRLMIRPGEESDGENNGLADGISASAAYDADSIYAALAYDSNIDGEDVSTIRAVLTWKLGDLRVGGLLQSTDWNTPDNEDVLVANASYSVGKTKLKLQLGHTENYGGIATNVAGDDNTADYLVLGADFRLGEKTTLGTYVGMQEGGDNLAVDPLLAGGPYTRDTIGVILIHSF